MSTALQNTEIDDLKQAAQISIKWTTSIKSHSKWNSVPGIARLRSTLSAACWTETSPLSTCFSSRSRSWSMTPSCTICTQLPSEERGKSKQVREREETQQQKLLTQIWEFRDFLPWLFLCLDKIETIACALFLQVSEVSEHQPPLN